MSDITFPDRATFDGRTASRTRKAPRRKRRALGLWGYMLAVLLAVVAIGIAFRLYGYAMSSMKDMELTSQLKRITSTIDSAYANTLTYDSGSLVPLLKASGQFSSSEITTDGQTLYSPYGGAITVTGSGSSTYSVAYADLPQNACMKLLDTFVGINSSKLQSISVNSSTLSLPPTPVAIASSCSQALTNNVQISY